MHTCRAAADPKRTPVRHSSPPTYRQRRFRAGGTRLGDPTHTRTIREVSESPLFGLGGIYRPHSAPLLVPSTLYAAPTQPARSTSCVRPIGDQTAYQALKGRCYLSGFHSGSPCEGSVRYQARRRVVTAAKVSRENARSNGACGWRGTEVTGSNGGAVRQRRTCRTLQCPCPPRKAAHLYALNPCRNKGHHNPRL